MTRLKYLERIVTTAMLSSCAGVSWSYTLAPGGGTVVDPAGTTAAAEPQLVGTVVQDVVTPFSYDGWMGDTSTGQPLAHGAVTGTVESRVVRANDGTYDFYWRVAVDRSSFLPVLALGMGPLIPAPYNVNWLGDGPTGVQPNMISEDPAGYFGWFFDEIQPGQRSVYLMLDTTARAYAPTGHLSLRSGPDVGDGTGVQWGGTSGLYPTFEPVAAVPEPAGAWLALAGLGTLGMRVKRERRGARQTA